MCLEKLTVANWSGYGADHPRQGPALYEERIAVFNAGLELLLERERPDVVTLQEIFQHRAPGSSGPPHDSVAVQRCKELGYTYYPFPLIDSERHPVREKWSRNYPKPDPKAARVGPWPPETFFAQGSAMLIHDRVHGHLRSMHYPWCLGEADHPKPRAGDEARDQWEPEDRQTRIYRVPLYSGLYGGTRDTEPREALVAHFECERPGGADHHLDVFVVNVHLTTLREEREGIFEADAAAADIRSGQLRTIFDQVIAGYHRWRLVQKSPKPKKRGRLWVLSGDFNCFPASPEYQMVAQHFVDMVPEDNRKLGTRDNGTAVDYIFAGLSGLSFDKTSLPTNGRVLDDINAAVRNGEFKASDHYPVIAELDLSKIR